MEDGEGEGWQLTQTQRPLEASAAAVTLTLVTKFHSSVIKHEMRAEAADFTLNG